MGSLVDLTGQRFGRWTVKAKAGRGRGLTRWICRCDCGTARAVIGIHLRQGRSLSCGCLTRKLKAAEVRAIRLDRRTQMAIAKDYGIAQSVVSRIKSSVG
jgi:hypothetical protein